MGKRSDEESSQFPPVVSGEILKVGPTFCGEIIASAGCDGVPFLKRSWSRSHSYSDFARENCFSISLFRVLLSWLSQLVEIEALIWRSSLLSFPSSWVDISR